MDPDPINYEQRSLYSCANIVVIIKKSLNVINTDWLAGQKEYLSSSQQDPVQKHISILK